MAIHALQDPLEARAHLLQSSWLARVAAPGPDTVEPALRWALEIVAEGEPLPPLGFVSDVGHAALGDLREFDHTSRDAAGEFDRSLLRKYEDYVVGKLYTDRTFERGSDALKRYRGRDQDRCVAYMINQLRRRAGFGGVCLSPAVLKSMLAEGPDEFLAAAWQAAARPASPELVDGIADLVDKMRNTGDLLGAEDVFELEHATALHEFGQRVALRQILHAHELLCAGLRAQKPRKSRQPPQVATRLLADDMYPVGGFSSISNKGSIESLLHSQLAFIEPEKRPDLFDIKFLRDELLYYARDENQFLRERRTFVFVLYPDLVTARIKDDELPWQRVILLLASLYSAVHRLIDWLSNDALIFDFVFVQPDDEQPLRDERTLLATLFREQIENGTVVTHQLAEGKIPAHCQQYSRCSQTRYIPVSQISRSMADDRWLQTQLRLRSASLEFAHDDEPFSQALEDGFVGWQHALTALLEAWS